MRRARVVVEGAPGFQEIQPQAEAGLDNGELRAAPPALGQRIAAKEHLPRLFTIRTLERMIDVAELGGKRNTVGIQHRFGVWQ